jgi:hypothetical protein
MSTNSAPAPEHTPAFLVNVSVPANSQKSAERMRDQLLAMFAGVSVAIFETKSGAPSPKAASLEETAGVPERRVDRMINTLVASGVSAEKVAAAAGELVAPGAPATDGEKTDTLFSVGDRIIDRHTKKEHIVAAIDAEGFKFGESGLCPWSAAKHFAKVAAQPAATAPQAEPPAKPEPQPDPAPAAKTAAAKLAKVPKPRASRAKPKSAAEKK